MIVEPTISGPTHSTEPAIGVPATATVGPTVQSAGVITSAAPQSLLVSDLQSEAMDDDMDAAASEVFPPPSTQPDISTSAPSAVSPSRQGSLAASQGSSLPSNKRRRLVFDSVEVPALSSELIASYCSSQVQSSPEPKPDDESLTWQAYTMEYDRYVELSKAQDPAFLAHSSVQPSSEKVGFSAFLFPFPIVSDASGR